MTAAAAPHPHVLSRLKPHGIWGFIIRRALLGVLTLFLISIIVFAATEALPGDPARAILGRSATPEALANLRSQLHLDQPLLQQYTHWLGGFVRGNPGTSIAAGEPVTTVIGTRLRNSAVLWLLAALISTPLAIALGVVSARRRDRPFDHAASIIMLALAALPEFVVAIALVLLFGTTVFTILPAVSLIPPGDLPWQHLNALVLPTLTLVIAVVPYTGRIMRASMVEVLESDYVEMARLKGVAEKRVVWRHAVPNAIAPTIQVTALNLAYLAGGIVVVEYVFGYAGIGSALVDAVHNRDIPVVQALAMLIAGVYVVLNVLADVTAILVSPRARTALK
ncbi:MAG TPA: ABC transporter permease [Polyangiaceae bacterium]|nr:ABC transporter permease [Polyangiaceae bacterium]